MRHPVPETEEEKAKKEQEKTQNGDKDGELLEATKLQIWHNSGKVF